MHLCIYNIIRTILPLVCVHDRVCVCLHVCMHMRACVHVCVCVCVCMCMCACLQCVLYLDLHNRMSVDLSIKFATEYSLLFCHQCRLGTYEGEIFGLCTLWLLHQADVGMPILSYAVWCMCASASARAYVWVGGMLIGKLHYMSMLPVGAEVITAILWQS